jgi:hypothetical protein
VHPIKFILVVLGVAASVEVRAQCLPGGRDTVLSPSGAVLLSLGKHDEVREEHGLMIRLEGESPKELYRFGRSVCMVWEPNEAAFALTDKSGSTTSEVFVVSLRQRYSVQSLMPLLPDNTKAFLAKSSHGYVEAREWLPSGLRLRVWGDRLESNAPFEAEVLCTGAAEISVCKIVQAEG